VNNNDRKTGVDVIRRRLHGRRRGLRINVAEEVQSLSVRLWSDTPSDVTRNSATT